MIVLHHIQNIVKPSYPCEGLQDIPSPICLMTFSNLDQIPTLLLHLHHRHNAKPPFMLFMCHHALGKISFKVELDCQHLRNSEGKAI